MAITIDKEHSALLAMDFGFAQMVKQIDVFDKTGRPLDAARRAGLKALFQLCQDIRDYRHHQ